MTTVLVTGGAGFVGRHLCSHLVRLGGRRVIATCRRAPPALEGVTWVPLSLDDDEGMARLIDAIQPDDVYHLASPASVPDAQRQPREIVDGIILGTRRLLETCAALSRRKPVRLLYVGSAEEYRAPTEERAPLSETSPLGPRNVYGACKLAASQLSLSYASAEMKVVCVRPFNQIGPGQDARFAIGACVTQIAELVRQEVAAPILRMGNLEVYRDFIDVEDSVAAHVAALERGRSGEVYNICSGTAVSLVSLVDALVASTGRAVRIASDPARVRSGDVAWSMGTHEKLSTDTGWVPVHSAREAAVRALRAALQATADP